VYGVEGARLNQRRDYVLEMAGLADRRTAKTVTLPVGLKQRLALGCAILHEPPILFLDEPTSGVDPIARGNFWELIYQLSAAGHTIFVTTHYMDEAEYCHRIALMGAGKVIALGSPEELKESLGAAHLLEVETSDLFGTLTALQGRPGIADVAVFGGGLHVKVDDEATGAAEVRRAIEAAGIQIHVLEPIAPSMEDVFVTLIEFQEKRTVRA
jgi:ABC-2 type transport system ATP-binding protein